MGDEVRRVFCESLLPFVTQKTKKAVKRISLQSQKKESLKVIESASESDKKSDKVTMAKQ
jgi:hypothetical protein